MCVKYMSWLFLSLLPCIGLCTPWAVEQIKSMPGLVALWSFDELADENRVSKGPVPYELVEMNGTHDWNQPVFGVSTGSIDRADEGPLSGYSAEFDAGQYFFLSNNISGALDIAGEDAEITIVAYIKREPRYKYQRMQFIAGMWDESAQARQYGLILDVPVGDPQRGLVYPHISISGGRSHPDVDIHIDVAANKTPVPYGLWQSVGMTYDGTYIRSYLNGVFEPRTNGSYFGESANPYYCPDGIGSHGADFTVGGHGVSGPGMYGTFVGKIGGLAVFNRALSESEMLFLHNLGKYEQPPVLVEDTFDNSIATRLPMNSFGWMSAVGSNGVDVSSTTADWWVPNGIGNHGDLGYVAKTSRGTGGMIWKMVTDELNSSDIHSFRFSLHNNDDEDIVYLAVNIDGQWYVSNHPLSMAGTGASSADWRLTENKEILWDPTGSAWSFLSFNSGDELERGAALDATNVLTGILTGYGIYSAPNTGTLRIDDFTVHMKKPFYAPQVRIVTMESSKVSLNYDTMKGWNYQLEVSTNLYDWSICDEAILGSDVIHNTTVTGMSDRAFFRFEVMRSDK